MVILGLRKSLGTLGTLRPAQVLFLPRFLMFSSYSCEREPWLGEQWLLRLISVLSNAVNA